MESEATYRGTVYPWQCDHVGHMTIMRYVGKLTGEIAACCEFTAVHLDRKARKSVPFADTIRMSAERHLAIPEPACSSSRRIRTT